jgi:hypothetical protein
MGNKSFNRENCAANLTYGLQHGTIPSDMEIFISSDFPNFTNPTLPIDWCKAICGSKTGWYLDRVPRLSSSLSPGLEYAVCTYWLVEIPGHLSPLRGSHRFDLVITR